MAANEDKLRQMREERERLLREKNEMETTNRNLNSEADGIDSEFSKIRERMNRAELRK